MDAAIWAKIHGATVHFPIALVLCSFALDGIALLASQPALGRGLRAAGYWTLLLGAIGTVPAVVSGLVMTRGVLLGHDALRLHHLFAWPAFALIIGIAAWRSLGAELTAGRTVAAYLALAGLAAALVSAAGYWGGELLLSR
jgi:uncharacterized membrane protein